MENINNLRKINHENITKLIGWALADVNKYIVYEYGNLGSVNLYLKGKDSHSVPMNVRVGIAKDVAMAMNYLASQNFVHGHLCGANVVLHQSGNQKIIAKVTNIDFANFVIWPMRYESNKWKAPEAYDPVSNVPHFTGITTVNSDKWSYGILLSEIFNFGNEPYPNLKNVEVKGHISIKDDMTKFLDDRHTPFLLINIIGLLLNYEPNQRPNYLDIIEILSSEEARDRSTEYQPATSSLRFTIHFNNQTFCLYSPPQVSIRCFKTIFCRSYAEMKRNQKEENLLPHHFKFLDKQFGKPIQEESQKVSDFFPSSCNIFAIKMKQ